MFFKILLLLLQLVSGSKNYTVHMVPHTHTDIGWLNTIDQYFYKTMANGRRSPFGGVNLIITTVIDSLLSNSDRKFVYSEFKYF